jgi:hypothetical protein
MQLSSLHSLNWFSRLEMQLISHPGAPSSDASTPADSSASDPATTTSAADPAAQVNPFAARFMAILIDAQAKHAAGAEAGSGLAHVPPTGGDAGTAAGSAAALVQAFDADGDGTISLSELQAGLQPGGSTTFSDATSARIARQFAKLDTDGDGQVSVDELTTAIQAREDRIAANWASKHTSSDAASSSGS